MVSQFGVGYSTKVDVQNKLPVNELFRKYYVM